MDNQHEPGKPVWPVAEGDYLVGDSNAPVAVCALTSEDLWPALAKLPGVAIAGQVFTANLGIEQIILNVTTNAAIRFLLLCGHESPIFRPGQTLTALISNGIDEEQGIIGAEGHLPVLSNLSAARIEAFRQQVELVDFTGESDVAMLGERIRALAERNPGRFSGVLSEAADSEGRDERFVAIRPGGRRQPLAYDPKGFFIVSLDRNAKEMVIRHYLPDNTPAHEMRGRSAESMLLGLLREDLVSQMSHAGYLGGELAKAEAALKLGLRYEQDRPLRTIEDKKMGDNTIMEAAKPPRRMMGTPPASAAQIAAMSAGMQVDVALAVEVANAELLHGLVLERDDEGVYHRSTQPVAVRWQPDTPLVMGKAEAVRAGAILQVNGPFGADGCVEALQIAIITGYVEVVPTPLSSE